MLGFCVGPFSFRLLQLFLLSVHFFLFLFFSSSINLASITTFVINPFLILIYPLSLRFHCFIGLSSASQTASFVHSFHNRVEGLKSRFAPVKSSSCVFLSPAKMRASIVVSFFLVAGALGKPINHHNDSEDAIVSKTVTVYATSIASGGIPRVTVSEAVKSAKSVTELASVVQPSETLNAYVVNYCHQHKWRTQNTTTSAACTAPTISVQTVASATQAATTAISTPIRINNLCFRRTFVIKSTFQPNSVCSGACIHNTHIHIFMRKSITNLKAPGF